jgi:hypothetical protein
MFAKMSHEIFPRRDLNGPVPKFRITVEERPEYVYAYIHSTDPDFRLTSKHIGRILDQCDRPGCGRIIIENRTGEPFRRDDFFHTAPRFPGFGVEHTRLAVVDEFGTFSDGEGIKIVVGQSSSIRVQGFATIKDAEVWLTAH